MSDKAEGKWMLTSMDEKRARRQGVPPRMPVPRSELTALADKGMTLDQIRTWIRDFLAEAGGNSSWRSENAAFVGSLEAFVSKTALLARAEQSFARNDYAKAISTLRMITSVDPDDHLTKMNLGSALANTGDHAGALAQFESIRATFGGETDYHLAVGRLQLTLGHPELATGEFVLALEADPACKPAMDALVKLGVLVAIYEDPRDPESLLYVRADGLLSVLAESWSARPSATLNTSSTRPSSTRPRDARRRRWPRPIERSLPQRRTSRSRSAVGSRGFWRFDRWGEPAKPEARSSRRSRARPARRGHIRSSRAI